MEQQPLGLTQHVEYKYRISTHPTASIQVESSVAPGEQQPLGLVLLDEPSVVQSDPTILELKLR